MASGSLHAALINSSSMVYSYAGTISHGGSDIKSDSVSGTGFDYDSFTIGGGPDGLTYTLGGQGEVIDFDEDGALFMLLAHQVEFGYYYPSTFNTSIEITVDFASAVTGTIYFPSPMFTDDFSGTATILINGNTITEDGSTFTLGAGSHTFSFLANGGNTGEYGSSANFIVQAHFEAIPEPGTWALLVGGAGLLALVRRRRAA